MQSPEKPDSGVSIKSGPHLNRQTQNIATEDEECATTGWKGPSDPAKPVNWSFARKWTIVVTTSLATFMVSFGSSVYSAAVTQIQKQFHVSATISRLGISLYLLGFAFGPLVWGPASELYGKTRPLWVGYLMFCLFQIPCAVSADIYTLLIFRLLAGLAGSSMLAILGGMYVDFLQHPTERGISTAIFTLATFCGPAVGPIIGNLVTVKMHWTWTSWITLVGSSLFGALAFAVTPETSEVVILRWRAQQLKKRSCNNVACVQTEDLDLNLSLFVRKYLTKPIKMFICEPILVFFTIYMSLVYGIIYLTFTMYPFAFVGYRGWAPIEASLPFLGILLGVVVACVVLAAHSIFYVGPKHNKTRNHTPEMRLPPMIIGSFVLPAGILWFAWTSDPDISWINQVPSGIFIGCGSILVFMSGVVYLIEVYLVHANSALAINNFVRSAFAASFPLFTAKLFFNTGIRVGGSVLGAICVVLIPFPFIFWSLGHRIRGWSKFAVLHQDST